jgi:hypothetical protein
MIHSVNSKSVIPGKYPEDKLNKSNLLHLFLSIIGLEQQQSYLDRKTLNSLNTVSQETLWVNQTIFSEVIYVSLKTMYCASLLLTIESATSLTIPENYQTEMPPRKDGEVILAYKNNGFLTETRRWKTAREFVNGLKSTYPEAFETITKTLDFGEFYNAYDSLLTKMSDKKLTPQEEKEFLKVESFQDSNNRPRLLGAIIDGKFLSIFRAREKLLEQQNLEDCSSFAFQGEYLYRSIRDGEWESIKKNKQWLVRPGDNFEKEVGSHVQYYKSQPGYAGVIVRIPNKKPYNVRQGFQVPRISNFCPHYIQENEIYVSGTGEDNSFISLRDWLNV